MTGGSYEIINYKILTFQIKYLENQIKIIIVNFNSNNNYYDKLIQIFIFKYSPMLLISNLFLSYC